MSIINSVRGLPGLARLSTFKTSHRAPRHTKHSLAVKLRYAAFLAVVVGIGWITWKSLGSSGGYADVTTTFTCTPLESGFTNPNLTTCDFQKLVLWRGELYIIDPTHTVDPPAVSVDWFVPNVTVPIHHAPSLASIGVNTTTQMIRIPRVVVAGFSFYHNFYHAFAEYAPAVHSLVCRHWGACMYNAKDDLTIVMSNRPHIAPHHNEHPVSAAAMQCVTKVPVVHFWHPRFENKVVVFERALVGFGPECRADQFHCMPWEDHRPPTKEVMGMWRDRVAKCIGFDPKKTAPIDPVRIVVIDRPYETGRHFINIDAVMHHLSTKYAGIAEVALEYLDGKSMQEQAAIYNAATIVIWNHGAAMANLIYAPVNSVGLQVVFMPTPKALFAWPEELVRDLPHNVTLRHMVNSDPDRLLLKAGWVRLGDTYRSLSSKEKLAVWERKQCPTAHGEATTIECDEFWVKIAHVLELDIELLDKHLTPIMDAFLAQKGVRGGRR